MKFKSGDRVRVTEKNFGVPVGTEGVVSNPIHSGKYFEVSGLGDEYYTLFKGETTLPFAPDELELIPENPQQVPPMQAVSDGPYLFGPRA